MPKLRNLNPLRAANDLRGFLAGRSRHELIFLVIAVVITGLLVVGFLDNRGLERPYQRQITYVQDWPLDRSLEQIRAAGVAADQERAERAARRAEREEERRQSFQRLDDRLKAMGI